MLLTKFCFFVQIMPSDPSPRSGGMTISWSIVSPSIIETPLFSPFAPPHNSPTPACIPGKPGVAQFQDFVQGFIYHLCTSGTAPQITLYYTEGVRQKLLKIASTCIPEGSFQDGELATPELPVPLPFPHHHLHLSHIFILVSGFL